MATVQKLQEYAAKKGGKLLSTSYIGAKSEYEWQDAKGRTFKKSWLSVRDYGTWSPFEAKENQLKANIKYGLDYCIEWCTAKGWKFLSQQYTNDKASYEFENEQGEYFKAPWKDVVAGRRTGPDQRGQSRNKFSLETAKAWVAERGGVLHATEWKGMEYTYYFTDRNGLYFNQQFKTCMRHNDVLYVDSSRGQAEIADFIKHLDISVKENDRTVLEGKEIDILTDKLAVEYHGLRWHTIKDGNIDKNYHKNKYLKCAEQGLELLQIYDTEWHERKFQIKSFLKSKLGKNEYKIGARKCDLVVVSKEEAFEFIDKYHIQGVGINNTFIYGLKKDGELLMLITIGKHHRGGSELVLHRCVAKEGTTVSGGLSRLCQHAKFIHGTFYTFVDLRWSSGKSWLSNGWTHVKTIASDYLYYNINKKQVRSKNSCRKPKGTPKDTTESMVMESQGFYQVYDCGKMKLKY
jgi:hypothetical protein